MALPAHEIVIPLVVFTAIGVCYVYEYRQGTFLGNNDTKALGFFKEMRIGWVRQNHLTGQAACNTTRDYLRVTIFFAGNSILLATVFAGFAAQIATDDHSSRRNLTLVKLALCIVLFLGIFFVFFLSTRYAVHLHFMINVKEIKGKPLPLSVISAVFNKAHAFYSTGIRMYYFCVPLFAWVFSPWALLAVAPIYMFMLRNFERLRWMQNEMDEFEKCMNSSSMVSDVELGSAVDESDKKREADGTKSLLKSV